MPGRIARAVRESGLLGQVGDFLRRGYEFNDDVGRQARGLLDAAGTVGMTALADIPSGVNGLLTLAATRDPDAAADAVERSRAALAVAPQTQEGAEHLDRLGGAMESAGNYVANTAPGRAANDLLYRSSAAAPLASAVLLGLLNAGLPEGRAASSAGRVVGGGLERGAIGNLERLARVVPNDAGKTAKSKSALFDDGESHISYRVDKNGVARVEGVYSGGPTRGVQMVEWLRQQPGVKKIVPEDVAPDAHGFWDKMEERGLLRAAEKQAVKQAAKAASRAEQVAGSSVKAERAASDFVSVRPKKFREALDDARAKMSPQDRAQVSPLPDKFKGRVFLSPDGKSGFGIAKDGELVSLFNHPGSGARGTMAAALQRGIAEGATHLNAFDTYLARGYGKRGAVERSRSSFNDDYAPEGWDAATMGRPDYVTMDLPPAAPDNIRSAKRKDVERAARATGGKVKRTELVDDEDTVRRRAFQSHKILDNEPRQPLDLDELRRTSLLDRSLIDDAMEGHPGVPQTPAERPVALREKKRAEIEARTREVFDDPVNRALLMQQAQNGLRFGGDTYYSSSYPLRAALDDPEAFRRDIAAHAGTSAQNALPNNFASQSVVLSAMNAGVDMSDYAAVKAYADRIARERGHSKYFISPRHVENVMKLINGGDTGLKIDAYNANLLGNFVRSTLDTHEAKGATIGSRHYPHYERAKGFDDNEYGSFEEGYRELGGLLNRKPAVFQAGRWYGGGNLTGLKTGVGDWLSTREHMIQYSAEQLGLPTTRSNLRKLLLDSARGKFQLVPYYPTKANPLPPLKGKPEKGYADPKLLAALAAGGGMLAMFGATQGEEE